MVGNPDAVVAHVPTQVAHVKVRPRLPAVVVCVRVLVDLQARPIYFSLRRA